MKKALIFYGGWDGHEPALVSARFQRLLEKHGYAVDRVAGVECLADRDKLLEYDLLVPCVTMSELPREYEKNVSFAVSRGAGIAGCHGGMCDSFRKSTEWQFMTGGQWVSHPGGDGIEYKVNICHGSSPVTEGLKDFSVKTEHYYLHIDPSVEVGYYPLPSGQLLSRRKQAGGYAGGVDEILGAWPGLLLLPRTSRRRLRSGTGGGASDGAGTSLGRRGQGLCRRTEPGSRRI